MMNADFIERRVLPLLFAFAAGFMIAKLAVERVNAAQLAEASTETITIECHPPLAGAPVVQQPAQEFEL